MRALLILALLLSAASAGAQEANPEKSAKSPWAVDPRCAVMAAHMYNQGVLTGACLAQEGAKAFLNPVPGYHSSQQNTMESHSPARRGDGQEGERNRL